MQQTKRCEATAGDSSVAVQEKDSLKRPRKQSAIVKHPPDAYIQRITCPTRQQFYKNLLQQELANTDRKILNACKCSSKLDHEARFKKAAAADALGDAPSRRVAEPDGGVWPGPKRAGRKTRLLRRLRHRRENATFRVRDRSTSVEDQQTQANVDGCEAHCKVARRNSALYNINESQKDNLKYGLINKGRCLRSPEQTFARPNSILSLKKEEGNNRRLLQPQGQQRNMRKPYRPGDASALKKQVLRLSSSQIMHLDIKPKGMTTRRELHCLPLRKNVIRSAARTAPHFVLFGRPSPVKINSVYRRGSQSRRYVHAPLAQRVTPLSRSLINNPGRIGSKAPLKTPRNVRSRKGIVQLYNMVSPNQKRFSILPQNTKWYTPNRNYKTLPKNPPGSKYTHQPRGEIRPAQSVKTQPRLRSNSLQHASYYDRPLSHNHSTQRQPRRILSTRSIGKVENRHTRTMQDPTFLKKRPSMSRKSSIPPGVSLLRSHPPSPGGTSLRDRCSLSREVTSLRNGPSMLSSGATSLHYRSSEFSRRPSSLYEKPSIYSSGAPSTSFGPKVHICGLLPREPTPRPIPQRSTARIIPQRPPPPRASGPNYLHVRPPVPSRAQTSISARAPSPPNKKTSMRDLLNNLKSISQRESKQSLLREHQQSLNSMFNRYPPISLRPLRKSATLSGYSYDVLPEKEEEESPNMEKSASSNTTYTVPPEQRKLTSSSTQTLICQERTLNLRA